MIEILGWLSTILVLIGYIFNAKSKYVLAMVAWIIGDIGWITYDLFIDNFSHMVLSLVIISINIYGIINLKNNSLKGI
jgi:hypothetical protein